MKNEIKVIDFMSKRMIAAALSLFLVVASLLSVFSQGLNLGLDFTGGIAIEIGFENELDLEIVRSALKVSEEFEKAQVQNYGNTKTIMIKVVGVANVDSAEMSKSISKLISASVKDNPFNVKRVDFIGPVVGDELRDQSGMAMLVALFIMLLYVAIRFSAKFALGAVLALFHDVIITFGFFSVTRIDFDLTVLAAVLAVIGYSLNDTIVVSDRIRENFKAARMETPAMIINTSLTQTLGRTIITSLTTLFVLSALFFMGGEMIKGFAIALIVGVLVGTYSSIYVASNILMATKISKQDFIEIKPEAVDDMP
jgi:preprotein translocase subunit SecF